ncbi:MULTISPECIES: hypothetical protein [Acinetobacter]|uniref:hypothetical protein n=1 Tax=Acinetobacter TaxID=469 RepID=UPI0004D8F5E0|nr:MULTISPECIES: hypothetical protein [Acinetobacter]KEC83064.1 hypothetical protein DT74_18370 [Acinetobacter sp. ETR1]MCG7218832.1 hypothetical protein [Acinetobacter sp. AG3]MDI1225653.1 hypothetical protein [Acinetobacter sp.]MDN5624300.1 hypothetical protein [Acinetobacter sp.]MDN5649302.1 hypothetical protein [Acinetobacter sp.]
MKNFIPYILVLGASLATTLVYADDEIKLKRSCIKDYPMVEGETNPELLAVYSQLCDKKNKDNKNKLLVSAAEKFQQIGKNDKAIQIVNYLETQNIQSNELTDVKFLAGIGLASDALSKMRTREMRYLTEDKTYPVAKSFTDAVRQAMPAAVLVEKNQESAPVVERARPQKVSRPQKSRTTPTRSTPAAKPATKPTATPAKPKPATSNPAARPNFPT